MDPKGVRLADSEIPSEEVDDPYPEFIQPLGVFKPVQQFCFPKRSGPHGGARTVFNVRVKESDFMKYSKLLFVKLPSIYF